jgi:hypothetical protein
MTALTVFALVVVIIALAISAIIVESPGVDSE